MAIFQIVEDLDTTIQGVQTAITLYTAATYEGGDRELAYALLGGSPRSRSPPAR